MSFRARILISFGLVVLLPMLLLAVLVPREVSRRMTAQYRERVEATATSIRAALARESARNAERLQAVARGLADDNVLRRTILTNPVERSALLDYSERSLLRSGLDVLQIQNDSGRILSSGHFRNDYDRLDRTLPDALRGMAAASAVVRVRTPGGSMLALAGMDSIRIGPRSISIVGGVALDQEYLRALAAGSGLSLDVVTGGPDGSGVAGSDSALLLASTRIEGARRGAAPNGLATSGERSTGVGAGAEADAALPEVDSIAVTFVDATGDVARVQSAYIIITQRTGELAALLRSVRYWLLGAALAAAAAALLVAVWLAARLSAPLAQLAVEAAHVDLDKPAARFSSLERMDEVGTLARKLGAMLSRIRVSALRLGEAERRAAVGEIARQVNHDIKNGLTPIRNVLRHLSQVAHEDPAGLPGAWNARVGTLDSSVDYLDGLARNYARLSPRMDSGSADIATVVEQVAQGASIRNGRLLLQIAPNLPPAAADSAVLRRILENLVGNAFDALADASGEVRIAAAPAGAARESPMLRISVADTGRGMSRSELDRAFDDFYTTKPSGTGLGLSVVRRLVADIHGVLRVESEPGGGTTFTVDIPIAAGPLRTAASGGNGLMPHSASARAVR